MSINVFLIIAVLMVLLKSTSAIVESIQFNQPKSSTAAQQVTPIDNGCPPWSEPTANGGYNCSKFSNTHIRKSYSA